MPRRKKHHRKPTHAPTRQENGTKILRGKPCTNPDDLQLEYNRGVFYYQFHGVGKTSRIMNCDNPGELDWLKRKLDRGARIIVRRNPQGVLKTDSERPHK